ncbi:MAG: MBL fold metallo-hydrolase [Candidatus Heimdallarchaeota archaeon]|nr:MAG: MBL fold metallo-hydrolase [Candidatus Heimdallarchaeota archaeon]
MNINPIITTSGKITQEIYHLDIGQYHIPRSCSVFLLITPKSIVIMDTGTSEDVYSILKFMKNQFPLRRVRYLIPSHHHFDHSGGMWKLWKIIKDYNPEVKILTIERTKKLLQDPNSHHERAKRTFGDFIGIMEPLLDENAYEIVEPSDLIKIPGLNQSQHLQLVSTPGHTLDHVCPTLFEKDKVKFTYLGEAAGGLLHSKQLVTLPSSMPPEFDFRVYIQSLEKLIEMKPQNSGYSHAGAVIGHEGVSEALIENKEYSFFFRDFVKSKFSERGETRFVVEQFIEQELKARSDVPMNELYTNYVVAVVYGQLIDLGLKGPK